MNKTNATTKYLANEANINAWHRRIRKAASKVAQLERDRERYKTALSVPDRQKTAVTASAPVAVAAGNVQLYAPQNLVDAGDFIGRGQTTGITTTIVDGGDGFVPVSNPPPIDWEHPEIAAQQVATREAAIAAPKVIGAEGPVAMPMDFYSPAKRVSAALRKSVIAPAPKVMPPNTDISGMPGVVMRSRVVSSGPSPFGNLGNARTRSR